MSNNKIVVLTAPSGAGKTTLQNTLINEFGLFDAVVSCTTRKMRDSEIDGIDYKFKTVREFEDLLAQGKFAETTHYHDNYYGALKEDFDDILNRGEDVVIVADYEGFKQIKEVYGDKVYGVFVSTSKRDCQVNMLYRGMDLDDVRERSSTYEEETNQDRVNEYNLILGYNRVIIDREKYTYKKAGEIVNKLDELKMFEDTKIALNFIEDMKFNRITAEEARKNYRDRTNKDSGGATNRALMKIYNSIEECSKEGKSSVSLDPKVLGEDYLDYKGLIHDILRTDGYSVTHNDLVEQWKVMWY